ncbi:FecR domain-containing protein [Rhodopirellula sp. P2]|uniref:FecR domain-containing protein n=1 Tax=Rhodopirellula sp. P2 TaxID=2127060 RepID=UPI0030845BEB
MITVRDGLRGFVVDTPNGRLIDQGTSFGVSVKSGGASVVEVFDGQVDIEVAATGETRSLTEQTSAWLLPQQILSAKQVGWNDRAQPCEPFGR